MIGCSIRAHGTILILVEERQTHKAVRVDIRARVPQARLGRQLAHASPATFRDVNELHSWSGRTRAVHSPGKRLDNQRSDLR